MSSAQQHQLGQILSREQQDRMLDMAFVQLGAAATEAWADPKTTDFYLYSNGSKDGYQRIGIRRNGQQEAIDEITSANARSAFGLLATHAGVVVNEEDADAETTLLDGTRVQFMHPPITPAPKFTFRKSSLRSVSFDELVNTTAYDPEKVAFLKHCVDERYTVAFVGPTGAGKTTGGKAFMNEQKRWEHKRRFIVIQDRNEVRPNLKTVEYYFVTKRRGNHPGYSGAKLLKLALSDDPDVLVFGELRDAKTAHRHKQALESGHDGGFTSFHAYGGEDAYERYGSWLTERGVKWTGERLARLVPAIVYCYIDERSSEFRTDVAHATGFEHGRFVLKPVGKPYKPEARTFSIGSSRSVTNDSRIAS